METQNTRSCSLKKFLLIIFFTCFPFFGCENNDLKTEDSIIESLEVGKELWGLYNISSYTIKLSVLCFCPDHEAIDVKVVEGNIAKINGQSVTEYELGNDFWYAKTIESLFVFIEQSHAQEPYDEVLLFNKTYGYPEEIYFDFDEMIADEEIGYVITSFTIN